MSEGTAAERWAEYGLYDETAPNAAVMAEVFEFFDSIGVDPADFADTDPGWIIRTVNERQLRPGPMVTAEDVRAHVGLDPDDFDRPRRAANYSADDDYTVADMEAFEVFAAAREMFSFDELLAFIRVLAASTAHIADATTGLFRVDVASDIEARGGSELEYAKTNHAAAQLLDPLMGTIRAFFLHELMSAVRRSDEAREQGTDPDLVTLRLAVGFVDLAGYTPLSGGLSPRALMDFVVRFEEKAFDVVSGHGGRVVKLIGDEVMFVAVDPESAVVAAADLLDTFTAMGAEPSGGVAYGDLVSRGGDYYGRVVNLAARMADLAIPGEILTDAATAARLASATFEPAGRRRLKGFDDPVSLMALVR